MDQQILKGLEKLGADHTGRDYVARFADWDAFWLGNTNVSYHQWLVAHTKATPAKEVLETCVGLVERVLPYTNSAPSGAHAVVAKVKALLEDYDAHVGRSASPLAQEVAGLANKLSTERTGADYAHNSVLTAAGHLASHVRDYVCTTRAGELGSYGYLYTLHSEAVRAAGYARSNNHPKAVDDVVLLGDLRRHIDRLKIEAVILKAAGPAPVTI